MKPIHTYMSFNPWGDSKLEATISVVFGGASLYIGYLVLKNKVFVSLVGIELTPAMMSLGALLVALICFSRAYQRMRRGRLSKYGLDVENSAVKAAVSLNWGDWKCWGDDSAYSGVGNIDLFASNKSGEIITIEIKSWHRIKYDKENLYYRDGKKMARDPIIQALRQVEVVVRATGKVVYPVLWLPRSSGSPILVRGVIVVRGSAKTLQRVLQGRF